MSNVDVDKTLKDVIIENKCVFINKGGHGVGELFLDGKRVMGLIKVTIESATNTFEKHVLEVVPAFDKEEVE